MKEEKIKKLATKERSNFYTASSYAKMYPPIYLNTKAIT